MSDQLDKIAPALVKAQRAMKPVAKAATNPHYKSKYATLDDIMAVAKQALNDYGICVLQYTDREDSAGFDVVTQLIHESGQTITGHVRMPLDKATPQAAGSAITYGRRYGLAALLGIVADEDDDGNAASAPAKTPEPARRPVPKKKTMQERSDGELLNLREWAAGLAKAAIVDQVNEELERRRQQSNTPLDKVPPALADNTPEPELAHMFPDLVPEPK